MHFLNVVVLLEQLHHDLRTFKPKHTNARYVQLLRHK